MNEDPINDKQPEDEMAGSDELKSSSGTNHWPKVAAFLFFVAMIAGIAYAMYERAQAQRLVADYDRMNTALNQTRGQLADLTAKLAALSAAAEANHPTVSPTPTEQAARQAAASRKPSHARQRRTEDPRWKKVQADLAENKKQIEAAQQDMEKTRTDLENKLSSTHDELNGSIARNHDELAALQKRGERNYYEFDLVKSKAFQHIGPIGIALRKANAKHLFCDLKLLVDDNLLTKKHVSLYEPVQFYPTDYGQPLEIVIYQINKNQARGYVSAPRFRQSELSGANSSPSAPMTSSPQTPTAGSKTAGLEPRPEPLD